MDSGVSWHRSSPPSQLEQTLRLEAGERDPSESRSLAQHNIELRRLLEEEQAAYKRKLQAYQEGQQRQAQLVQKLQAKVLQYKKKCGELEQERLTVRDGNELENALIRLEEEQQRSSSLVQVNSMLREQLEQANVANAALSEDIRKLTADWARARDELEQREAEWRREEEVWGGQGSGAGRGMWGCGMEREVGRGVQDRWEGCGVVGLLHGE
uniref:Rootletin-like coiled-coil domain-containing protein n=1 Tax=Amazona collaria TaxID=241587 RepID=A0A8B9F3T7_9PSIT